MKKKITSFVEIKKKDPHKEDKLKIIEGLNRISDLINSLKRDMENRFLIVLSIIVSGLVGLLITKGELRLALYIILILIILLIFSLVKEQAEKKILYKEGDKLVKHAKKIGLDLNFRKKRKNN